MTSLRTLTATFSSHPRHVRSARHCFAGWLGHDHPAADSAVLLLSEVFTNGAVHGPAPSPRLIEISAALGPGLLRVEVTDGGGEGDPAPTRASSEDEHGRGLELLKALSQEWGWRRLPDERLEVWFTLAF